MVFTLLQTNKISLISSLCLSTSICSFHHSVLFVSPEIAWKPPFGFDFIAWLKFPVHHDLLNPASYCTPHKCFTWTLKSREQSGSIQYRYLHILIGINPCSVTPSNDQQSSVAIAWKITIKTHKEHYSGLFDNLHITVVYAQYEDIRPHNTKFYR